jgi:hypothetical protein
VTIAPSFVPMLFDVMSKVNRERSLPRFVCPRTFLYLWILLGLLLLAGGFVTWFARGPLFVGAANTRPAVFSRLQRPSPPWPPPPISLPAEDCR